MKKRDFYKKIKQYPELFDLEQNEQEEDAGFQIDEKDIPPIPQWFYDYEEQERRRAKRKRKARTLVAVPICAALVFVFLMTPFGGAFADNVYKFFVSINRNTGEVSTYYGPDTSQPFTQGETAEVQHFPDAEAVRKQYGIGFAENTGYKPDNISVSEIENYGYNIELDYTIDSNEVTIINVYHFTLMQQNGSITATGDEFGTIDTWLDDNTHIVGIYDDAGAIAVGYNDQLEMTFITNTLPYDQLIDFIQTTTIR